MLRFFPSVVYSRLETGKKILYGAEEDPRKDTEDAGETFRDYATRS